ncbi:nicotinamide riboside transporter PnuC [Taibaiella koreensis]|uniref:nicotinamide riboside transporter PnuC n=1 Tax=Taibaiella koreensis TaxID=1268548 RepID=UPI000E59CBBC|nr:nicotinamide riboside transporter PnuC [Taibaiella koreensis]
MDWSLIAQYIAKEWQAISTLEIVAVAFSVAEVLLSYRNNVLLYPSGIIACSLSIWLMGRAGLYAEAILSLYYLVMSFYGWYKWVQRNKKAAQLPISACTPGDWRIVAGICVVSFVLLFFTLKTFTDSSVPYMDAFVSATAWAGMWLLARRKVENWILLNISNIVAIPLLFYKHLPLMALLTAFLFTVAVLGYFRWKRIMKEEAMREDELRTLSLPANTGLKPGQRSAAAERP